MSKTPRRMVTLESPDGKRRETVEHPGKNVTKKVIDEELGLAGYKKVADHDDTPPPPELTPEQLERARWEVMTKTELAAVLGQRIAELEARVAKLEGSAANANVG